MGGLGQSRVTSVKKFQRQSDSSLSFWIGEASGLLKIHLRGMDGHKDVRSGLEVAVGGWQKD